MDQLLSQLEEMSYTCSHQLSYTSAAKCFAALVNKRPQGQSALFNSPPDFFVEALRAAVMVRSLLQGSLWTH